MHADNQSLYLGAKYKHTHTHTHTHTHKHTRTYADADSGWVEPPLLSHWKHLVPRNQYRKLLEEPVT